MIDLLIFDSEIIVDILDQIGIDGTLYTRNKINLFFVRKNIDTDKIAKLLEILVLLLLLLIYIYYHIKNN